MSVWEFAGRTDLGRVRSNNEDSFLIDEALGLLVVADGMGGHSFGEEASALAVRAIREAAAEGKDPVLSIRGANALIREKARSSAGHKGMGTTVVAVWIKADAFTVAHVGDSRCYLFRKGLLSQLTHDHSLAEESRGLRHILTRAVGAEETVEVDVSRHELKIGDRLLLASDGLTTMLNDEAIGRILANESSSSRAAAALVEAARQAGGADNITVVCGRFLPERPRGFWEKAADLFRRDYPEKFS